MLGGGFGEARSRARQSSSPTYLETLDFFGSLGIAVFPQRRGLKGSYVQGWPDLPVEAALALTREEAGLGPINLAGRSGHSVAVLDYDGKEVDPRAAVDDLLPRLDDALIGVVETGTLRPETGRVGHGLHVWMAVKESVGNGFCTAIGGEVFSGPHLAMLPPSRHPDSSTYRWLVGPRVPTAAVDLCALGLVPDKPEKPSTRRATGRSRQEAASPQRRAEFERLMAKVGIHRGPSEREKVNCVWHDDRHASLSVDWPAAIFHCFGCEIGGGIVRLCQLVGEPAHTNTPSYLQGKGEGKDTVDKWGYPSVDVSTARLAEALARLDEGNPNQTRARDVAECGQRFRPGKCTSCASEPAFPITCGMQLCPNCGSLRLAIDWRRHQRSLPSEMRIVVLRTPEAITGAGALRKVRSRFREWRKRTELSAGLHGARYERRSEGLAPVILLAMASLDSIPTSSRAFLVEEVADHLSPDDVLRWLRGEYQREATLWETDEELRLLLSETRGRRKFQGFGSTYGGTSDEDGERKLDRVSGGSAKGGDKSAPCPVCGGHVDLYRFTVPAEQVARVGVHWLWTGPASGVVAA